MSDVSPKIPRSLVTYLASTDHDRDELLAAILAVDPGDPYLTESYLLNGTERMPWNSFCSLSQVLEGRFSDESAATYTLDSYQPQQYWAPFLKTACRLIASPLLLYRVGYKLIGPSLFGKGILAKLEVRPDGTIHVRLKLAPGYKENRFFFKMSQYGIAYQTMSIGLPKAAIRASIGPTEALYEIIPPPSFTLVARFGRAWRSLFSSRAMWIEQSRKEEQLRSRYDELSISESALRTAHEKLEERVAERTQELTEANKVLQEQLKQIVLKERENEMLSERILNLQKLDSLGTLAGGIAHEINNVLHGIFLSIDLVDRKIEPGHPGKEKISAVTRFALRGQELTRQILAFSRKNQIEHRAVDVCGIVRNAVAVVQANCLSPIRITLNVESQFIWGDDLQLQQIVVNLLNNAKDASAAAQSPIEVVVAQPQPGRVVISVIDCGDGIPEGIRSRLFDPFFTTKPVGKGSGMGLAVAHGLAQSLSGRVLYEARDNGAGSEFKIILSTCPAPPKYADFVFDETRGGNESLLIVDDEVELLELLKDTLDLFGYRVFIASSGIEALKIFETENIDLVLTDHIMPMMNGTELAKSIKALNPETPILMCTGYSEQALGPVDKQTISSFVSKPIDAISLNESIRAHLQSIQRS